MKPRFRGIAFVLLIVFMLLVSTLWVSLAQEKPKSVDAAKPVVVTPFTTEESYGLTDAEKTKVAQDRIIDELNDKLAVAVFTRKAAVNQFNEIAAKYPGEVFTRSKNGLYEGHRQPTDSEKGK